MLMAYFTRTSWTISAPDGPFYGAWITADADGPFPRGRLYAFRNRPDDYEFLPSRYVDRRQVRERILSEVVVPGLGRYLLIKPPAARTEESAAAAR